MLMRLFICFLMSITFCCVQAQREVDAPDVSRTWGIKVPVYQVSISGDTEAVALAKRALSTHGSFNVVQSGGQYSFVFEKTSENSLKLSITGSTPFSIDVVGKSFHNAVAKACDIICIKSLGAAGYFSGNLAFVSDRSGSTEIYTSDFLFQDMRAQTSDKADVMLPHFSPDGTKIMYTGYLKKLMDLYEIDLNARTRRTFASFKGTNTGGAYSPDGSKVALILSSTGNPEVWVANVSGSGFKRLTKNSSVEASATWSANGKELLYSSDELGSPNIYRMNADGSGQRRIATNISRYCAEPSWNPKDSNLIVFTAAEGSGFQLAVYDMSTKKSAFITRGGSSSLPKWTNDGRHIIFTKTVGKNRSLYIVDYITGKQTKLHSDKIGNCAEADFIYTN